MKRDFHTFVGQKVPVAFSFSSRFVFNFSTKVIVVDDEFINDFKPTSTLKTNLEDDLIKKL